MTTQRNRTQVDQVLAQAERRHAGDEQRSELIMRTRRFKSSWHELGEALTTCQGQALWAEWGYSSFDEYTRKELRLKTATVQKLVGCYSYLSATAPAVLARDGLVQAIPSPESVLYLRKAAELCMRAEVSSDVLEDVRVAVLEQGQSVPALQKQFQSVLFPEAEGELRAKQRRSALRTANQLIGRLEELRGSVPETTLTLANDAILALVNALGDTPQFKEAAPAAPPATEPEQAPKEAPMIIDEPDDLRVREAHQKAVVYLMSVDQGVEGEDRRRLRKSLHWHLSRLSDKNWYSLARLFPDELFCRLLESTTEEGADAYLRRSIDGLLARSGSLLPKRAAEALGRLPQDRGPKPAQVGV